MDNEIKRCTGHCCEMFFLPFTPKQLKSVRKLKLKKGMNISLKGDKAINSEDGFEDIRMIAEMVIPLSPSKEILESHIGESANKNSNWYTCKNFDTKTRNCKIYNSRPYMCREFPYGFHTTDFTIPESEIDKSKCYYKSCTGCQNTENVSSICEVS